MPSDNFSKADKNLCKKDILKKTNKIQRFSKNVNTNSIVFAA